MLDDVLRELSVQDVTLLGGTSLDDARTACADRSADVVIMGAGIDLEARLETVRHIFTVSNSTTMHMKDFDSGPQGCSRS